MQNRQDMVEQVLNAQAQPVEVALRRGRQVGAALESVPFAPTHNLPGNRPQTPAEPSFGPQAHTFTSPVPKGRKTASGATIGHPAARPEVSSPPRRLSAPVVGGQPHRPGPAAQQTRPGQRADSPDSPDSPLRPAPGALTSDPEHPPGARGTAGPRPWRRRWRALRGPQQRVSRSGPLPGHETPKRTENGLESAATPPCGRREENG